MEKRYTSSQGGARAGRRRQGGFTLLEIFIVVVVVAILVSVALPSYSTLMARNQVTEVQNELVADIAYARTEAVSRQVLVEVVATSGDWSKGWSVIPDENQDGKFDSSDTTKLRTREAVTSGPTFKVKDKDGTALTVLVFGGTGAISAPVPAKAPAEFVVCGTKAAKDQARKVQVQGSGSVNSLAGSASSFGC